MCRGDGKYYPWMWWQSKKDFYINWPHTKTCTEINRRVSKALFCNFPILKHLPPLRTLNSASLLWRPCSSIQAHLIAPKLNCGPELPLPHPGTKEARESLLTDKFQATRHYVSFREAREAVEAAAPYHSTVLGFLREKFDSGLSIRNNSLSPEQNFSPLTNTNSPDKSCLPFALVA